jgi:hypothetical protein
MKNIRSIINMALVSALLLVVSTDSFSQPHADGVSDVGEMLVSDTLFMMSSAQDCGTSTVQNTAGFSVTRTGATAAEARANVAKVAAGLLFAVAGVECDVCESSAKCQGEAVSIEGGASFSMITWFGGGVWNAKITATAGIWGATCHNC